MESNRGGGIDDGGVGENECPLIVPSLSGLCYDALWVPLFSSFSYLCHVSIKQHSRSSTVASYC